MSDCCGAYASLIGEGCSLKALNKGPDGNASLLRVRKCTSENFPDSEWDLVDIGNNDNQHTKNASTAMNSTIFSVTLAIDLMPP